MKQGWEIKPLGEICDSINGLWKGKKEPFVQAGVIRNTNFTKDCLLDVSDIVCLDVEQKAFSKRSLTKGDIIIERSGGGPKQPVGRAVLFNIETGDFSFSNFTSILRLKNGIKISYYYLHKYLAYFYLSGKTECMQSNVIGIRNLDFDRYKNEVLVPFPSLSEQERIVGILDSAFAKIEALRANAQQNLQNTKDLFQASLKQELTPKQKNKFKFVKDLFDIKTGKLNANAAEDDGIYPFFTCSRDIFAINKAAFDCEAILLAGNNASGDFNVKYYKGKFNAYQRTYVITPKSDKTHCRLLYYVLGNYLAKLKSMSVGANTKFLKLGMIENVLIADFTPSEQLSAIEKLDALSERCRAMEENYRQTIAHCNALKQALLTKAFNGEL